MATYIFGEGPAATVSGTHKDTYIDGMLATDDAYGGEVVLYVSNTPNISLMRFDISSIPAGETISSATLRLYLAAAPAINPVTVAFYRLTTDWGVSATDEGASASPAAASQATYNRALANPTDTPWAAGAGGTYSAADIDVVLETTQVVLVADAVGTAYDIALTALVSEWHTGAASNYGVALQTVSLDGCEFDSQESLTAAERPSLTVVTTAGGGSSSIATKISRTSIGVRV